LIDLILVVVIQLIVWCRNLKGVRQAKKDPGVPKLQPLKPGLMQQVEAISRQSSRGLVCVRAFQPRNEWSEDGKGWRCKWCEGEDAYWGFPATSGTSGEGLITQHRILQGKTISHKQERRCCEFEQEYSHFTREVSNLSQKGRLDILQETTENRTAL
jgi:hypothetical protein